MRKPALSVFIFLVLACAITVSATVVFTTEPPARLVCDVWPPYQYKTEGRVTGFSTEMVEAVYERLGTPISSMEVFPWKRALEILESGNAEGLFSVNKTRDRAIFARFPEEPLFEAPWIIWTKRESPIRTLDDLKGRSVGVVIGYSYTPEFWEFIQTYCKVEQVTTDDINLQKLANERLDAVAAEYGNALYLIRKLKLRGLVPRHGILIKNDGLYLMFNRRSVSEEFTQRFSEALKAFKRTPEYEALRRKYFEESDNP
ncbi:MAG: transporter substrate-binding domain-containing protein [Pseudodesulfovibrio sp.]